MKPRFPLKDIVVSISIALMMLLANEAAGAPGNASHPQLPVLNWQQRSDWVNVKTSINPPAVGDGKTDDTQAIQKALDGIQSGSTVYFPPGTYRITQPLKMGSRAISINMIGHGRDTRLLWDGAGGGTMLTINGFPDSRYTGIEFDGNNRAGIGIYYFNTNAFISENQHIYLAFRNFRKAGIYAEAQLRWITNTPDGAAIAETTYENCIFENCAIGVRSYSFNDLDHTFTGCEFRNCGIGVYFGTGNFYIRDTHFEGSLLSDVKGGAEAGCSLRRVTSVNSRMFLDYSSLIAPLTVEDCHVANWKAPDGALRLATPEALIFDCDFSTDEDITAVALGPQIGSRILSGNRLPATAQSLFLPAPADLIEIPPGKRTGAPLTATQSFLKSRAEIPGRIFDAKKDFGATGNGSTDDTAAVQAAVDAARNYGNGAMAYLPTGVYAISHALKITGKNYYFGGAGYCSSLVWKGAQGGIMVEVNAPKNVTLENIGVGYADTGCAAGVEQTGTNSPSSIRYERVFVYGCYKKDPNNGMYFRNLGGKEVVVIDQVQGNMHFVDSAQATVLANVSYEGAITVEGQDGKRGGFLGFMTRLATSAPQVLIVRDSHSIVMSDFYIEQAGAGYLLSGQAGDPPGRVTIQSPKMHFRGGRKQMTGGAALEADGYHGDIILGPDLFYTHPKEMRFVLTGSSQSGLVLFGSTFYNAEPSLENTSTAMTAQSLGNKFVSFSGQQANQQQLLQSNMQEDQYAFIGSALDDYRQLGSKDLEINFPEIEPKK